MATYHNAHTILSDVREGINEHSTALLQATDTSGAYTNAFLMKQINRAQRFLYSWFMTRLPEAIHTYSDITGTSSGFALPADFGVLEVFLDENYKKCYEIKPEQGKLKDATGSDRLYYRKGDYLLLDKGTVTETYRLWYWKKARELDQGQATGDDTLAATASAIADYYNGMSIESITAGESGAITDYTAARVITPTGIVDDDDYYGIVSDLPEPFHHLIAPRAIMYVKSTPQSLYPVTPQEIKDFTEDLLFTFRAYAGQSQDMDIDDVLVDLEPTVPVNIGIL